MYRVFDSSGRRVGEGGCNVYYNNTCKILVLTIDNSCESLFMDTDQTYHREPLSFHVFNEEQLVVSPQFLILLYCLRLVYAQR